MHSTAIANTPLIIEAPDTDTRRADAEHSPVTVQRLRTKYETSGRSRVRHIDVEALLATGARAFVADAHANTPIHVERRQQGMLPRAAGGSRLARTKTCQMRSSSVRWALTTERSASTCRAARRPQSRGARAFGKVMGWWMVGGGFRLPNASSSGRAGTQGTLQAVSAGVASSPLLLGEHMSSFL